MGVSDVRPEADESLTALDLSLDADFAWVQQWKAGNLISGEPQIDALVNEYGITIENFHSFNGSDYAYLATTERLNIRALTREFEKIPGVIWADDREIEDEENDDIRVVGSGPDFLQLEYRESCPGGCFQFIYHTFEINNFCRVVYMERLES